MTSAEVKSEIERVFDRDPEKELAELAARLRRTDDSVAFRALFPFASRSQELGPAAGAAWLLYRVNPKCPISCLDATRELLRDWDISIEEVPFYLAEQFGSTVLRATVETLRTSINDAHELERLRSVEYWLGCYDEMQTWRAKDRRAEPNAAPNGGPATPVDSSTATEGPPSVS